MYTNFILMWVITGIVGIIIPPMERFIHSFGRLLMFQVGIWGTVLPCTVILISHLLGATAKHPSITVEIQT